MQYISSDTSVWIDFVTIQKTEIPFRLPYTYIMNRDAVEDEILSPPELGRELLSYGLVPVAITIDEFFLAEQYGINYAKLSRYDRIALAIAKCRQITLLTGDGRLRKAAKQEGVPLMGTLGILDQLWDQHRIGTDELKNCLQGLLDNNGGAVRLPAGEILSRLEMINSISEEKLVVESGYTTLMRYNPKEDKLYIDSREPNFDKYEELLMNEVRYRSLYNKDKEIAKELLDKNKEDAIKRYNYYKKLVTKE